MEQPNFEDGEQIFSWRQLQAGKIYRFVDKEVRGNNKWNKPISVVTLKESEGGLPIKFYAPPSLHFGLNSRQSTMWIKYEGVAKSDSGYHYPVFTYAS